MYLSIQNVGLEIFRGLVLGHFGTLNLNGTIFMFAFYVPMWLNLCVILLPCYPSPNVNIESSCANYCRMSILFVFHSLRVETFILICLFFLFPICLFFSFFNHQFYVRTAKTIPYHKPMLTRTHPFPHSPFFLNKAEETVFWPWWQQWRQLF
jgi:hypothetical protein